jgi:hypothetical protein
LYTPLYYYVPAPLLHRFVNEITEARARATGPCSSSRARVERAPAQDGERGLAAARAAAAKDKAAAAALALALAARAQRMGRTPQRLRLGRRVRHPRRLQRSPRRPPLPAPVLARRRSQIRQRRGPPPPPAAGPAGTRLVLDKS